MRGERIGIGRDGMASDTHELCEQETWLAGDNRKTERVEKDCQTMTLLSFSLYLRKKTV